MLSHTANNNDFIVSFGTSPKDKSKPESMILRDYNLVSQHAYSITGYDEKTKMVKIINPHSCAGTTEIPIEVLHKYINHLEFIKP